MSAVVSMSSGNDLKPHATLFDDFNDVEKVTQRPSEAVVFGDHHRGVGQVPCPARLGFALSH